VRRRRLVTSSMLPMRENKWTNATYECVHRDACNFRVVLGANLDVLDELSQTLQRRFESKEFQRRSHKRPFTLVAFPH
jgi:hypothetical protein